MQKEFKISIGYHLVHGLKFMSRYELPSLYSVADSRISYNFQEVGKRHHCFFCWMDMVLLWKVL